MIRIREDAWLAEIMARPVFRLEAGEPASADADALAAHVRQQERGFYYAKVDAERIDTVRLLAAAGFVVVDTNVVFELDRRSELPAEPGAVAIGALEPADEDALLEVAATAFTRTRFHLDPLVGADVANAIKRSWCQSYARQKRGDRLFVAKLANDPDRRPAGFLAALTTPQSAVIDLIGVAPAFQRRRVGAALTAAFVEHYRGRVPALQVGTQVANIPSIRLYERSGFSLVRSQYVLHLHVEKGHPRG
jgi:dTDP-4-amino-4,6-dideoxy-D-galactose acyltransferase